MMSFQSQKDTSFNQGREERANVGLVSQPSETANAKIGSSKPDNGTKRFIGCRPSVSVIALAW